MEALADPQTLLSIFAAVAIFATIITLAMPLLAKDELGSRMKSVAIERDKIRARERARLAEEQGKKNTLRQKDEGFVQSLVEKFNLKAALADENTFLNLTMAGYRQKSHINIFLFFKVVLPILMLALALVYFFVISPADRSPMINILFACAIGMAGFYLPSILVKNAVTKRQLSIKRSWPDALDLLLICVESGMSLEASMKKVAVEIGLSSAPLAEELTLTTAELSYLSLIHI